MTLTLAALCLSTAKSPPIRATLFRFFAFIGRYGHQPISDLWAMTRRDLHLLATELKELLDSEKNPDLINPD